MYDEVAKTSTPEMKQELMELSKIIQDEALKVKWKSTLTDIKNLNGK